MKGIDAVLRDLEKWSRVGIVKVMRDLIKLELVVIGHYYTTTKNKRNSPDKRKWLILSFVNTCYTQKEK